MRFLNKLVCGASVAVITAFAAPGQDKVSGFSSDWIMVYAEAGASEGEELPSCAFSLPTEVLEVSAFLRVRIEGPEGPVWVGSADIVAEPEEELPPPASISRGQLEFVGGTRETDVEEVAEVPTSRGLPAGEAAQTASLTLSERDGEEDSSAIEAESQILEIEEACEYPYADDNEDALAVEPGGESDRDTP